MLGELAGVFAQGRQDDFLSVDTQSLARAGWPFEIDGFLGSGKPEDDPVLDGNITPGRFARCNLESDLPLPVLSVGLWFHSGIQPEEGKLSEAIAGWIMAKCRRNRC